MPVKTIIMHSVKRCNTLFEEVKPCYTMGSMSKNEFIGTKCEASLKKDLEKLAKEDRRTLSDYVRLVLEKHVADKKRKSS